MGQDKPLREVSAPELTPVLESKREGRLDVGREKIQLLIDQVQTVLNGYTIMPDSFLMPEDYSSTEALETKKQNKLRTSWFTLAFTRLEECLPIVGFDQNLLDDFRQQFQSLLAEESQLVKEKLKDVKPDPTNPTKWIQYIKELKRELAPSFVESKTNLVHSIEFVLRRCLAELQKKYAS